LSQTDLPNDAKPRLLYQPQLVLIFFLFLAKSLSLNVLIKLFLSKKDCNWKIYYRQKKSAKNWSVEKKSAVKKVGKK